MRRWLVLAVLWAGCSAPSPAPPPPPPPPVQTASNVSNVTAGIQPTAESMPLRKYPGARRVGGGALRPDSAPDAIMGTLDLETSDPVEKVEKFYAAELKKFDVTRMQDQGYRLVTLQGKGLYVTISRTGSGPTRINLTRQR